MTDTEFKSFWHDNQYCSLLIYLGTLLGIFTANDTFHDRPETIKIFRGDCEYDIFRSDDILDELRHL